MNGANGLGGFADEGSENDKTAHKSGYLLLNFCENCFKQNKFIVVILI